MASGCWIVRDGPAGRHLLRAAASCGTRLGSARCRQLADAAEAPLERWRAAVGGPAAHTQRAVPPVFSHRSERGARAVPTPRNQSLDLATQLLVAI